MKELDGYRECLAWLTEQTDGRAWVSTTEIAQILGVHRDTVKRRFGIAKGCALPILAQKLTQESR